MCLNVTLVKARPEFELLNEKIHELTYVNIITQLTRSQSILQGKEKLVRCKT